MCVCLWICAYMYEFVYVYMSILMCVCLCTVCAHVWMQTCVCVRVCICAHVNLSVFCISPTSLAQQGMEVLFPKEKKRPPASLSQQLIPMSSPFLLPGN